MWYFAWILGIFLACFFAIITAMVIESNEAKSATKDSE